MNRFVNATDDTFSQDVLQSELPVLVDFWADWCMPCKMIAPLIEEAAVEYEGKLKVVKFDVQNNQNVSIEYQIRGIPALMIFKDGKVQAQHVGALSKSQLSSFIKSNI